MVLVARVSRFKSNTYFEPDTKEPEAMRAQAITVCRYSNATAAVTIYDRHGRSVTYRDLVRGTAISIRFR